jgi:hypothetical protein
MTGIAISALPGAVVPLSGDRLGCVAPCVQNGVNAQVPAAAFAVPIASVTPPTALGQFQTWIDQSTSPPALRMYVDTVWTALYTLGSDGTLTTRAALALPADPTASQQVATKNYVDTRPGAAGSMIFRGTVDCSGAPNYPAASEGDVYIVSAPGKIGGASGLNAGTAALLLCIAASSASGTQAAVGANWTIVQGHNTGLVLNPASAANGSLALFSGSSGRQIASGGTVLDTDPTMAANSDTCIPSQKAVKAQLGGKPLGSGTPAQGNLLAWDNTAASFRSARCDGRNLLVNSSFDLWEETTSYTFGPTTANTHIADFWKVGGATSTGSLRTARHVNGFSGARGAVQILRAPGSLDTNNVRLCQQFGSAEALFMQGKPLTLSFDVLIGANFTGAGIQAGLTFGTGVDEVLALSPGRTNGNVFPTGSGSTLPDAFGQNSLALLYPNTLTAQLPPPGFAGHLVNQTVTIPANWSFRPVTEAALVFDIGPFFGQAGADDSISITNVKLEVGNVSTPYLRPWPEEEQQRCQSRYRKSFQRGAQPRNGVGLNTGEHRAPAVVAGTAAQSMGTVRFPPMRVAPTVSLYSPFPGDKTFFARDLTAGDCTSTVAQKITETGFEIVASGHAATAVGNTLAVHWVADARL